MVDLEKTLEESVLMSLDGEDTNLYPHLPYILQDIWEIGTSADTVIKLINQHALGRQSLSVLDLGCGKGAVSINIAKVFKYRCHGIDAVKAFVSEAQTKAASHQVEQYCRFQCGDIREMLSALGSFDIIILGSIGPVFGNYYSTLSRLAAHLNEGGMIIIDDGYIDDTSDYSHPPLEKKSMLLEQISAAGMKLIDEIVTNQTEIVAADESIFKNMEKRCQELIERYPLKSQLFRDYLQQQKRENDVLENKIICATMLIGR